MYIYDISKHALSTDGHCEGGGDLVRLRSLPEYVSGPGVFVNRGVRHKVFPTKLQHRPPARAFAILNPPSEVLLGTISPNYSIITSQELPQP